MGGVRFYLRCIKNGIVGFCGGSPPQKSGIIGMIHLLIYFLIVATIIMVYKSEMLSPDNTVRILLFSSVIYFATPLFVAVIYDLISHIRRRNKAMRR